jgi:hypothetical protein
MDLIRTKPLDKYIAPGSGVTGGFEKIPVELRSDRDGRGVRLHMGSKKIAMK